MTTQSDHALLVAHGITGGIPRHMRTALADYLAYGHPTGDFLKALLSNDLYGALHRADLENRMRLPNYIDYLTQHADPRAYGTHERYDTWVKTKAFTIDPTGQPVDLKQGSGARGQVSRRGS